MKIPLGVFIIFLVNVYLPLPSFSSTGWPLSNVKFPDISLTVCGTPAHVKCYSYHASTKYWHGCKYAANNKRF